MTIEINPITTIWLLHGCTQSRFVETQPPKIDPPEPFGGFGYADGNNTAT